MKQNCYVPVLGTDLIFFWRFRIEEDIRIHPRFAYRSKRNTALERRQTQLEDCWEQFGSLGHDVASTLCNDLLFDLWFYLGKNCLLEPMSLVWRILLKCTTPDSNQYCDLVWNILWNIQYTSFLVHTFLKPTSQCLKLQKIVKVSKVW